MGGSNCICDNDHTSEQLLFERAIAEVKLSIPCYPSFGRSQARKPLRISSW